MSFSLCPHRKLLFGSQSAQSSQGSDPFRFQAALAFLRLMTSSCGVLCRFAVFACRYWRNVLFHSIAHWILCWLCWWTRCWILQDMDHIEASCVFYVEVGTLNQFEQSKIWVLTVTTLGTAMLAVDHDMMISVSCMYDPRDFLRQTSADVRSFNECTVYMS